MWSQSNEFIQLLENIEVLEYCEHYPKPWNCLKNRIFRNRYLKVFAFWWKIYIGIYQYLYHVLFVLFYSVTAKLPVCCLAVTLYHHNVTFPVWICPWKIYYCAPQCPLNMLKSLKNNLNRVRPMPLCARNSLSIPGEPYIQCWIKVISACHWKKSILKMCVHCAIIVNVIILYGHAILDIRFTMFDL